MTHLPPSEPGKVRQVRKRRVIRRRRRRKRYRRLRLILFGVGILFFAIALRILGVWFAAIYYSTKAVLQGELVWVQPKVLAQKEYRETRQFIRSLDAPGVVALDHASQPPHLPWCQAETAKTCLKRIKRRFPLVYQELQAAGLNPSQDPYAVINGLDLLQIASSSSSRLFSRQYPEIKTESNSNEQALVTARVRSILNGNPLDTPNLTQNCPAHQSAVDCLYVQQRERVQAIHQILQPHIQASFIVPAQGTLSQGFDNGHTGIDIANAPGTPIQASASGEVIFAGWDDWGLGNMIKVRHPDESIAIYGHNEQLLVGVGDRIEQGQIIAKMGNTGNSTGPHLHFELHLQDQPTDPLALLTDVDSIARN